MQGFETRSVRMERLSLLTFQAPAEDVDRIMEAVVKVAPLVMGNYDSNAYHPGWVSNDIARSRGPPQVRKRKSASAPERLKYPSSFLTIRGLSNR